MSRTASMVLGTAQLGLAYGIRGLSEAPDQAACDAILVTAWKCGISALDTASAYGVSEDRIGQFLIEHPEATFEVTTKLGPAVDTNSVSAVIEAVERSISRLRRPIDSLLLHRPEQMADWSRGLKEAFSECRSRGWIRNIGVSIYSPDELERTFDFDELTEIQLPANVFDQRFFHDDPRKRAQESKKRLTVRSVFLQGLLLMDETDVARRHPLAYEWVEKWNGSARRLQRERSELAVQFVLAALPEANLVIGCDSPEQVAANVELFNGRSLSSDEFSELRDLFSSVPVGVADPRKWKRP